MTGALLASITGLALLDSLNPATVVTITLILLTGPRRPLLSAVAFIAGAYLTVLVVGLLVFLSAGAAAGLVPDAVLWLRRIAFSAAAVALLAAAVRRLRPRARKPIALPDWFSPGAALPLGTMMTGADLPNAFPYFIAIERLISAQVTQPTGNLILAAYAFIYCLPCMVLLVAGMAFGRRVRTGLARIQSRLSTGTVKRSLPAAALLTLAAAGVGTLAVVP
ncbi:MAG: GAP family protein [Propionibacteriaceae bacterium]|nr:GAP family protein [Propionibacteriaceae bacterium]